jgi:hypothetical protein
LTHPNPTITNGGSRGGHRVPNRVGIPAPQQKKQGLVLALGEHIFDYNVRNAAAQMHTTWEKIIEYVSSTYSNDISTELATRTPLVLSPPEHSKEIQEDHDEKEKLRQTQLAQTILGLKTDLKAHKSVKGHSARVAADMENEIDSLTFAMKKKGPIVLEGDEKTAWDTEWKNYNKRKQELIKHRGQCFDLIRRQCTRTLIGKMEHDASWSTTIKSGNPLLLYDLIKKTILAQSEETYPFAIIYNNESDMYLSRQNKLTNNQWYHQFVTAANVAASQGVERQHGVLRDYVAKQLHGTPYDQLTDSAQKDAVCKDAAERYLAFVFLSQSGEKHNQLRADLKNQFMSGHDNYPRTVQAMLRFLDNYDQQHSAAVVSELGGVFSNRDTDLIYDGRTGGRFLAISTNDRIVMKNLIDYYNANIHFNGGEELDWIHVNDGMFNRFCAIELPRLRVRYAYNSFLNASAPPVVVHTPGPVGSGLSPAARLHQEFRRASRKTLSPFLNSRTKASTSDGLNRCLVQLATKRSMTFWISNLPMVHRRPAPTSTSTTKTKTSTYSACWTPPSKREKGSRSYATLPPRRMVMKPG